MSETLRKKRGRPRKGDERRVRTSLTLRPDHVVWLQTQAAENGTTVSGMIEQLICNEQQRAEHVSTPAQLRFSLPHEALIHFCREYRVKKLSLFGSILRNDFTPKSDIDVLIEFELGHDPTYFTVVEMEEKLSRMLGGRKIDLKTAQELSQHLRPQVLKEAEVVYAA